MNMVIEPQLEMRDRILDAAIEAYADLGFKGASTREIAKRAGTSQGLLTYHFKSKDDLWYASVDKLFEKINTEFGEAPFLAVLSGDEKAARTQIKKFLNFNSKNPHLFKFVLEGGKELNERSKYLVDNHVRSIFDNFRSLLPEALQKDMAPHVLYAWMGAAMTIYSVREECEYLTGVDPCSEESINRQAELITHLFLPSSPLNMMMKAVKGSLASFKGS